MTGTETSHKSQPDDVPLPCSLPRHQAKECREYSLSRVFFWFYFSAIACFVALALMTDALVIHLTKGIGNDYTLRFMRGTVLLIADDLTHHPEEKWGDYLNALNKSFSYSVSVVSLQALNIPEEKQRELLGGEIIFPPRSTDELYYRLGETDQILVLGRITAGHNAGLHPPGLFPTNRVRLCLLIVSSILFGILMWLWMHPFLRDLESMQQLARNFSKGDDANMCVIVQNKLLIPLADTLNAMVRQIQGLMQAQKELASAISHELRTPIARLRFVGEMMLDANTPKERERLSQLMENDLEELDRLIDASLSYARFERETMAMRLDKTQLIPWLNGVVDQIRPLGRGLDLRVHCLEVPENLTVYMDRYRMSHALSNLLRNAVKYAQKRVDVILSTREKHVIIHVDDDGVGVPLSESQRIFSAFTRLNSVRKKDHDGYGLGLFITQRVLELHDGDARVSSSPLGGARFTLCWPYYPSRCSK